MGAQQNLPLDTLMETINSSQQQVMKYKKKHNMKVWEDMPLDKQTKNMTDQQNKIK